MKLPELKKRFKNKYVIRIAAGVLTVAIAGTSYGAYTVHAEKSTKTETVQSKEDDADAEDELKEVLSSKIADAEQEVGKEETVYVVADNTGKADTVIVSDWLKNPDGKDKLEDVSDLKDITNVKGNEKFTQKDEKVTWKANGNDIYYQGTTDKKLPVEQTITYYMDGKEMSPDKIAGKSGKVTIRFDYKNTQKTTETVNGKQHEVYVPFTVLTGMILDDSYSNVEVSNGKVISDGDNQVVVGVAMPGLSDSLKVDSSDFSEDVDIPEYIEVTADVKDFSLNMTMNVMMSTLMSGTDFDEMFELDALDDAINTMSDSSKQLADGSKELADGLDTLNSKMGDFSAGIAKLKSGVDQLNGKSGDLISGVSQINDSAKSISDGLASLDNTLNASMSKEEQQAVETEAAKKALTAVDEKLADSSYASNTAAVASYAAGVYYDTMTSAGNIAAAKTMLSGNADLVNSVKVSLREQVAENIGDATISSTETALGGADRATAVAYIYNNTPALRAGVQAALGLPAEISTYSVLETAVVDSKMGEMATTLMQGIANSSKDSVGASVAAAAKEGAETAAQEAAGTAAVTAIGETKKTVAAGIEQQQANGYSLVSGAAALSQGTEALAGNMPTLSSGITALVDGTNQISTGTGQLSDGISKLEKGSNTLSEGMIKFDEEGIQKLADTYNGDVKDLVERIVAVMQAGSDYQAFSKVSDGTTGAVKFVTRTEGINVKED